MSRFLAVDGEKRVLIKTGDGRWRRIVAIEGHKKASDQDVARSYRCSHIVRVVLSGDEHEYKLISRMSIFELMAYTLAHPYYLSDSYYHGFDTAICKRFKELKGEN